MKRLLSVSVIIALTIFASSVLAQQAQFTNDSGFGMTNGQMAAPIVGTNGAAYLVTYTPAQNIAGTTPSSQAYQSTLMEITLFGTINTITLNGISSQPVIVDSAVVATTSLADQSQFQVVANFATGTGQSMLYIVPIPMTSTTRPFAVALDGRYASAPVVSNNRIYVVTSDFGNALMSGVNSFSSSFGSFDFTNQARSFLYVIGLDGTLIQKTELM